MSEHAFVCPHCGVYSTFRVSAEHKNEYWGGYAQILNCNYCHQHVYVVLGEKITEDSRGNKISQEVIVESYPKRVPKMHESITKNIADDYIEAIKCLDVGANKGAIAMCRRALQSSALEKGASKDKLIDQIDELWEKGIITKDIREWAHEIRLSGNIGAHPNEDGLMNVTAEDAKGMIEFLERYFEYVYVMPYKVYAQRLKRKKSKEKGLKLKKLS